MRPVPACWGRPRLKKPPEVFPVLDFHAVDETIKRKACPRANASEAEKHLLLGYVKALKANARVKHLVNIMAIDKSRFLELARELVEAGDLKKNEHGLYIIANAKRRRE